MTYLPFWAGGLALASVALAHHFLLRTQLGVSGRMTALVNAGRDRLQGVEQPSDDELLAALRAMTEAEFGEVVDAPPADTTPRAANSSLASHALFLLGLALGGTLVAAAMGTFHVVPTLSDAGFRAFAGGGVGAFAALFGGGILVGVGTRMAGGCTSGHGLVGVANLEPGSLLATAAFFGAGIGTSLLMAGLR